MARAEERHHAERWRGFLSLLSPPFAWRSSFLSLSLQALALALEAEEAGGAPIVVSRIVRSSFFVEQRDFECEWGIPWWV